MDNAETEIITHPYEWTTGTDTETGYTTINCWSLDRDSKPNLLRIHDFDAFCYVELPLILNNIFVSWEGYREKLVYEAICNKLGEDDRPHRYMFVRREKLYFFKGLTADGKPKTYPMLLLCFHSVESMMTAKRKLSYPFKIRGLKGGNDETMVPLRVWETNIPIVRKLLTLRNCKFSQWFKIKGIKIIGEDKISTLENEYVVDWKTLVPIPAEETMTWLTKPTLLSFDIETYSDRHNAMPDPFCAKHVVYMISVVFQRLREPGSRRTDIILFGDCSETKMANVIKVKTEMELIDTFQELIMKYDPDIISGYNFLGYDNPFLETRLKRRMKEWKSIGRLSNSPSMMRTISWSSSAYKNQDFNILEMGGRISIDLLPLIKRDFKLPLYNLGFVSNHFLKKTKHPITVKQMFETYELQSCLKAEYKADEAEIPESFKILCKSKGIDNLRNEWIREHKQYALDEMKKVVEYCIVDSDLVVDLFEKLNVWIGLISMSNIMGITPMDIFLRGTGVRMESQIYDECSKNNIVLDEVDFPHSNYEGGLVVKPASGLYNNIPIYDFGSLYPSIICAENVDHTTAVPKEMEDKIPDELCNIIEWDGEENEESDDDEDDEDDENEIKKNKKEKPKKIIHYKYKFMKQPIGVMPRLLTRLIAERNKVRAKQKNVPKDSLEWNILEQTQLGIKIICNSFYGACGSSFSRLKLPFAAAAITAKARESTRKMNAYLEDKGHHIIYGDSVTGDTPLLLRVTLPNGEQEIMFRPIARIRDGTLMWEKRNGKEYCVSFGNLEVWSDKGFTKVKHVMRHKTEKKIFRITAHTGVVKVTEDHSLLNSKGEEITPNQLNLKDLLLTKEMPELPDEGIEIAEAWAWGIFYGDGSCGVYESCEKSSWAINNLNLEFLQNAKILLEIKYPHLKFVVYDTLDSSGVYKLCATGKGVKKFIEEWRLLFYDPVTKYKKVPDIIWKTSKETRIQFFNGYYSADGDKDENGYTRFDNKGQIGAAGLFLLSKSLGFKVSCNTRGDKMDIYRMTLTKNYQRKHPGIVKKIEDLGVIDDYVYDLETDNHHFSAGVGELVVHNTDSTMPDIGITDTKTAWEEAEKIAKELSALFPKPMYVELEAIFSTMLSIGKKMYLCIYMDKEGNPIDDPDKMKIRGVTLARRDNCKFQREFYKPVCWKVMHKTAFMDTFNFIVDKCISLASHSVPWEDLVMIKGLGSHYKSASYMMAIFSREMEKSGNPIVAGDRIPYIVVKTENEPPGQKLGYKMRSKELFLERAMSDKPEHIDYLYYLEKSIANGIQRQLFQIGYKKELEELEAHYKKIDQQRFFKALEYTVYNMDRNPEMKKIRLQGYRNKMTKLREQYNTDTEVIEALREDEVLSKIVTPLYSYHIKRRKGRGRRLSSRVDKEPITMMVRIMRAKEEVMKSIRNYVPKEKIPNPLPPSPTRKIILKIL